MHSIVTSSPFPHQFVAAGESGNWAFHTPYSSDELAYPAIRLSADFGIAYSVTRACLVNFFSPVVTLTISPTHNGCLFGVTQQEQAIATANAAEQYLPLTSSDKASLVLIVEFAAD